MTPLTRLLLDRLATATGGRLPFAEVMDLALYHAEYGYYGPGPRRLGRSGDFYTAVSVGPFYGQLLATLARQTWGKMGSPTDFAIIEQGAHDGQLAEDILAAGVPASYWIVEPNTAYQQAQRERLAPYGPRVNWVAALADLPAVPALYVCNELPDAMPVHLIRWNRVSWEELYVQRHEPDSLELVPGPLSSARLAEETQCLPSDLPAGYTTEINLAALDWMRDLAAAPFRGRIYIADYGLDDVELYAPERHTGTLRRYIQHRTDDHVLEDLGQSDLTTHVNFTRLSEEAEAAGLRTLTYEHQGRYLGRLGLPWLVSLEGQPPTSASQALLRQYQSLTHPAFMGRSFRILVLEKA